MDSKKNQIYLRVYKEIIKSDLYEEKYFKSYDEFLLFCQKDFSKCAGLELLVKTPQIKLSDIIVKKICQYTLESQTNEPVTYFRVRYKR